MPEPRAQGHLRSQGKDCTVTVTVQGAEEDLGLSWNQLGFFVLLAFQGSRSGEYMAAVWDVRMKQGLSETGVHGFSSAVQFIGVGTL